MFSYFGCDVEVVKRHKVALQHTHQHAEVHPISEVTLEIIHLQVDEVELLVDKGDEGLKEETRDV